MATTRRASLGTQRSASFQLAMRLLADLALRERWQQWPRTTNNVRVRRECFADVRNIAGQHLAAGFDQITFSVYVSNFHGIKHLCNNQLWAVRLRV